MINTLDELTSFLKICRKQGVSDIKFGAITVAFGAAQDKKRKDEVDDEEQPIPADGLTDEQLMDYHITGAINESITR